jgi:hypothetical protein
MKLPSQGRRTRNERSLEDESWVDREVAGCKFQDERLGERFRKLLKQIEAPSVKPYPLHARIGLTQRLHIDFSPMIASTRRPFYQATFRRRMIVSPLPMVTC